MLLARRSLRVADSVELPSGYVCSKGGSSSDGGLYCGNEARYVLINIQE